MLIETFRNEHLLTYTLQSWFDIKFDKASDTAERIRKEINGILERIEKEEEEYKKQRRIVLEV